MFRDLLDAGSVELSLARRAGEAPGDNPVLDAVIGILEADEVVPGLSTAVSSGATR